MGKESLSLDREALRHWRLQRGWTQEALSRQRVSIDGEVCGISYAQIRRIEKDGRAGPASARLLAAVLGVELAQLRPRDLRQGPCGLPREPSVDFVGRRAQIEGVLAALERDGSARAAVSIEGLPGIGKTELALQICARCEHDRSYRIFWFNAQGGDLSAAWSGAVAQHLGIEHPDAETRAKLALRAVEALGEPTLVVLDNLEHWSSTQPWPRPHGRHIRWLVTTRTHQLGDRAFEHVELPVLDAPSARELLLRVADLQLAERPGCAELLAHLDGYTIAIELAAAFLRRFPEVGPDEYLKVLLEGKRDLLEEEVSDRSPYQATLDRSLELLWRRLPEALRAAWVLAARFAQERASHALSDACGLGRKLRAQLREFHLIQSDPRGWSMHRLTRAFARRAAARELQQAAQERFLRGCTERCSSIDWGDGFRTYAPDRAHFDAAVTAMEESGFEAEALSLLRERIGIALHSLGEVRSARRFMEQTLAAELRRFGEDHLRVAYHRRNLGLVLLLHDRSELPRARELLEQALAAALSTLGEEHETVTECRSLLAEAMRLLGDLSRAKELREKALDVQLRTLGEEHGRVASGRSNLAVVLQELGEFARSRELLEQALESDLRNLGADHPTIAVRRSNLGVSLLGLGEAERARELVEQALESDLRNLGEDHWHVALRRGILGRVLTDLGELPRARDLFEQAIAQMRTMGEEFPNLANTRSHLAQVLLGLGELSRAQELLEQVLDSQLRALGAEHPNIARDRARLARVLERRGERAAAREQLSEARRLVQLQPPGSPIRIEVERATLELAP